VAYHGQDSELATAVANDVKGKISIVIYMVAIILASVNVSWLAGILYVVVAIMWLIPDQRLEKVMSL
jgi:hypothetical protein